jgi:hypothetical protein
LNNKNTKAQSGIDRQALAKELFDIHEPIPSSNARQKKFAR